MGEELELGNLFVVCDDGTYVPFAGITEIDLNDIPSDADTIYAHFPNFDEPITLEFNMMNRTHRKVLKYFKAQMNAYRRRIRHLKRQKERARRRALKDAKYT